MYARQFSSTVALGKLMRTIAVSLGLSLGLPAHGHLGNQPAHADTVWTESFESDGQCPSPGCGYTASPPFNDKSSSNGAYWDRGKNNNFNLLLDYVAPEGTRYWAAEAVDSDAGDGNATQTIDFNPINISPYTDLTVSALFAATQEFFVGGGFPWNQNNGEGIQLQYQVDGGGFQNGVWFKSNGTGPTEAYLARDTNFDGVGDTSTLTTTFTEYGFDIPDGNTLELRIEVKADSASEEVAFDFLQVVGTPLPFILADISHLELPGTAPGSECCLL